MSVTSSCTLVLGEERLDPRCLVRQEVVGDHMDLLAVGLVHREVGQNLDALGRGLRGEVLPKHLACLGVERRVVLLDSVSWVMAVPLREFRVY